MKWQPIETAPKDGTEIDIWAIDSQEGYGRRLPNCRYLDGQWLQWTERDIFDEPYPHYDYILNQLEPLYWMPLPESPE